MSSNGWADMPHKSIGLPGTIREINDLPNDQKCRIYRSLIPRWVFLQFDIDPMMLTGCGGSLLSVRSPSGSSTVEIALLHQPGASDPVFYLHMGDTLASQLIVLLAVVNDPYSPRYNIDVDAEGYPTQLGTLRRNIPEEIRAMNAGLMPGQVRPGLRAFRSSVPDFDLFIDRMGHALYFIEPLFYHNAIMFERYGFGYVRGHKKMLWINDAFQPGGELNERLNGSTPFRPVHAWNTVSGRSWAIHDGILQETFSEVQMFKQIDKNAGIVTFPNALR